MLQDAVWKKFAEGPTPAPVKVTPDEVLEGLHDSRLVEIEGKLINRSHNDAELRVCQDPRESHQRRRQRVVSPIRVPQA